jgi:hypothetical protein
MENTEINIENTGITEVNETTENTKITERGAL